MRSLWLLSVAMLIAAGCDSKGTALFGTTASSGVGGDGGSGTAGAGGSSTSTSGTGGGGPEDCLNGVDDNGNGLIDCQDVGCQIDYECVSIPPLGWEGIGWLTSQSPDQCPAEMPMSYELYDPADLNAPPATCECSCSSPSGVQCKTSLSSFDNQQCTSPPLVTIDVGIICDMHPFGSTNYGFTASAPFTDGGACSPSGLSANIPPVTWPSSKSACMRDQGGVCDGAAVCLPRQPANGTGPCIVRSGQHNCPPTYSVKMTHYDGSYSDTRDCGGCTCGPPSGGSCTCISSSCGVSIHSTPDCVGGFMALAPASGACVGGTGAPLPLIGLRLIQVQLTNTGSCTGTAPPIGSLSYQQGAITVCCEP